MPFSETWIKEDLQLLLSFVSVTCTAKPKLFILCWDTHTNLQSQIGPHIKSTTVHIFMTTLHVCSNGISSGEAGRGDLCQRCTLAATGCLTHPTLLFISNSSICGEDFPPVHTVRICCCSPRTIFMASPRQWMWIKRILPLYPHTDRFLHLCSFAFWIPKLDKKMGHDMVSHTADTASQSTHTHVHPSKHTSSAPSCVSLYALKSWVYCPK